MEKSTKKFRNLESDQDDVSTNHRTSDFKIHLGTHIATTDATAAARTRVIYHSIALFFLYRTVYAMLPSGARGGRRGGICEKV